MTKTEAARILNVKPNASRRQIDKSYGSMRQEYVRRSQLALNPEDRDVAMNALVLLQEAYRELTGQSAPPQIAPLRPRGSSRLATPTRTSGRAPAEKTCRPRFFKTHPNPANAPRFDAETLVASAISTAMFLLALIIFAAVWKGCS